MTTSFIGEVSSHETLVTLSFSIPEVNKTYTITINNDGTWAHDVPAADLAAAPDAIKAVFSVENAAGTSPDITFDLVRPAAASLSFNDYNSVGGVNIVNFTDGQSGTNLRGLAPGLDGQQVSFSHSDAGVSIQPVNVSGGTFLMNFPASEIVKTSSGSINHTITASVTGAPDSDFVYQYHDFVPTASGTNTAYSSGQAFSVDVDTDSNAPPFIFGLEVKNTSGDLLLAKPNQTSSTKPVTFNISAAETNGWPDDIVLHRYSENKYSNGQTIPQTLASGGVLACMGMDLYSTISAGYTKPPKVLKTPNQVFASWDAALNHLNSQQDHGGNVYQVAGGNYTTSTGNYRVSNARNFTLTCDPANPAVMTSNRAAHTGVEFELCDEFEVSNLEFHGYTSFGIAIGFFFPTRPGSTNGLVLNNHVHDVDTVGITVRGNSSDIVIEGNELNNIGDGSDGAGEGVYLGVGSTGGEDQFVQNITVRGNHIHDNQGEAVDVKKDSRGIDIEYNLIHDIDVKSQGAITVLLNEATGYDGDVDVFRNIILNTTTRDFNGNAITAAYGGVRIRENIIAGTAADAIDVYADYTGPNKNCIIERNVIWDFNGLPVRENVGNSSGHATNNPATITRANNVVESGAAANDCNETSAVFIGPLGNADYDAGSGPGSAFTAA